MIFVKRQLYIELCIRFNCFECLQNFIGEYDYNLRYTIKVYKSNKMVFNIYRDKYSICISDLIEYLRTSNYEYDRIFLRVNRKRDDHVYHYLYRVDDKNENCPFCINVDH
jgi:hypothetical protein